MNPLDLTLEQRAALRAEVRTRAHALRREAIAQLIENAGASLRRLLHLRPQRRMTERTHA